MLRRPVARGVALLLVALMTASCGGEAVESSDPVAEDQDAVGDATEPVAATSPGDECAPSNLALEDQTQLTVATGEPVFEPWMVDDDPTNEAGFESALVYALAEELGFQAGDVEWVRTGFDEAIAPGDKPYDFNIQQYSISDDRDEVVDFSTGYYQVEQALVAAEDSELAGALSLQDLRSAQLGAAIGTTSLAYVEEVIQPESQTRVFDDNAAAKAAFDAGQVDGLVFDLPTAYFITAVEIPDASIVGVLPRAEGDAEQLGLLFQEGSELVTCVDRALAELRDAGTLEQLEEEWLNQGGAIPTLER